MSEYLLKRRAIMMGTREPDMPKAAKPIPQKSEKQKSLDKQYIEKRNKFMKAHAFCQAKLRDCTKIATECHHSLGRGEYLLDESTYVALCHNCHEFVTQNPTEAAKLKLSGSRLAIHDQVNGKKVTLIDKI